MDNMIGKKFGRWLVLSASNERKYGTHRAVHCRCECGTERLVSASLLRRGQTASCGCTVIAASVAVHRTHGKSNHRLYGVWRSMKERCRNPNHIAFKHYGGRGIHVCERWLSFEAFFRDNVSLAKPGLTLDRINNDGPYSPENCRWATPKQQTRNRRNNRLLTFNGITKPLSTWAEEYKMHPRTLFMRLECGWPVDKAVTRHVRYRSPNRR